MEKKPAKHILVPNHTKLSDSETKQLLEKHNLRREHLPRIFISDPAIKDLDPESGDIIKIERRSPTAGVAYFYRVVSRA